ncbi:MAG: tetratricopeptide repeat protein [Hyphomicrobiaceae bacterium]
MYGMFLTYIGYTDEALAAYKEAERVDPHHLVWLPWYRGFTYFTASCFDDAIEILEPFEPKHIEILGVLAASYAYVGRLEEAEFMLSSFLRAAEDEMVDFPGRSTDAWVRNWHSILPYKNEINREIWAVGLRKAGLDP